jgi:hypothetical protein
MAKNFNDFDKLSSFEEISNNMELVAMEQNPPGVFRSLTVKLGFIVDFVKNLITPADIGAATAAQGVLAASAVQPNTSPTLSGAIITGQINRSTAGPLIGSDQNFLPYLSLRAGTGDMCVQANGTASIPVTLGFIGFGGHSGVQCNSTGGIAWTDSNTDAGGGTRDLRMLRYSAGCAMITGSNPSEFGDLKLRDLIGAALGESTVGTLPLASAFPRARYEVTDAFAPVIDRIIRAGGTHKAEVRSNGSNWIITKTISPIPDRRHVVFHNGSQQTAVYDYGGAATLATIWELTDIFPVVWSYSDTLTTGGYYYWDKEFRWPVEGVVQSAGIDYTFVGGELTDIQSTPEEE